LPPIDVNLSHQPSSPYGILNPVQGYNSHLLFVISPSQYLILITELGLSKSPRPLYITLLVLLISPPHLTRASPSPLSISYYLQLCVPLSLGILRLPTPVPFSSAEHLGSGGYVPTPRKQVTSTDQFTIGTPSRSQIFLRPDLLHQTLT